MHKKQRMSRYEASILVSQDENVGFVYKEPYEDFKIKKKKKKGQRNKEKEKY